MLDHEESQTAFLLLTASGHWQLGGLYHFLAGIFNRQVRPFLFEAELNLSTGIRMLNGIADDILEDQFQNGWVHIDWFGWDLIVNRERARLRQDLVLVENLL